MVRVKIFKNTNNSQLVAVLPKGKMEFLKVKGVPKFLNLKEEDFEF